MLIRIRDLFDPWIRDGKIGLRDKHPGSATLICRHRFDSVLGFFRSSYILEQLFVLAFYAVPIFACISFNLSLRSSLLDISIGEVSNFNVVIKQGHQHSWNF
jgi:hypothetical protein